MRSQFWKFNDRHVDDAVTWYKMSNQLFPVVQNVDNAIHL